MGSPRIAWQRGKYAVRWQSIQPGNQSAMTRRPDSSPQVVPNSGKSADGNDLPDVTEKQQMEKLSKKVRTANSSRNRPV
jgi:hypothetical protein